jgi:hypothetical protein
VLAQNSLKITFLVFRCSVLGLPDMEWGFDGNPVRMADAFACAMKSGRNAFLAGPMIGRRVPA